MAISEMIEIERRWILVDAVNMDLLLLEDGWKKYDITQMYLDNPKKTERIRVSKDVNQLCVFTHTTKETAEVGQLECEEIISEARFTALMKNVNLKHQTIIKTRYQKQIEKHTFEVDQFIHPFSVRILEVELDALEERVEIPSYLGRFIEVTGDKSISNFNLSLRPKVAKKNVVKYITDFLISEKEKLKSVV